MLNAEGETKDLLEIFKDEAVKIPPAGSGECCEPKLLQYAYQHGYKPLQMAMFWWGESPKEEIRHHLQFYPACNGKCKPILHWMLPKTVFETQQTETTIYNKVETLYEDRELAVIYKPEGLLSVPGKDAAQPSVYALMRRKYQEADRSAHRPSSGHGNKRTDDYCQDRVCLSSSAEGVSESSGSEEIRSHRLRERQGIVQPDSERS